MRTPLRLLALGFTATASLVLASSALAVPDLLINGTTIQVTEEKSDAAPLKFQIYIPSGYTANLTQAVGTQVGTVHADLQALQISPDAIIQADGTVLTDDPAKHKTASDIACAGSGTHVAVILLHVVVSGQTIDVPGYLDAPLAGPEAALGAAKLSICLSNPYEQAAPGTRAPFGVKIINAKLTFDPSALGVPASGETHWTSLITPWTVNGATPNAAGTVEARSIDRLPKAATLKATVKTKRTKKGKKTIVTNTVVLTGLVSENGQPIPGATADLMAGTTKAASATTDASGAFSKTLALKTKTSFQAQVTVAQRDVTATGCAGPSAAPAGCVSATMAGFTITSPTASATPKKK